MRLTKYFKTKYFKILVALASALLLASGVALVTSVKPAKAAFPGENGRIAYSGWDGSDYEIFTIPPNGGTPTQLTNTPTHESFPSYSPDGSTIAYVTEYNDGNHDISIIPASGGTPTQLTNNPTYETYPTYSPDGSTIAYAVHDGNDYDLYTIPASGGTPTQLTNDSTSEYSPSYSPDGSTIAYIGQSCCSSSEIYTISADGGTPTQLTNNTRNENHPTYSPDASRIAYVSSDGGDDEIYAISADGGSPIKLTDNTTDESSPTYSPDGSKLAYTTYMAYGGKNSNEIYAIPASGGTPIQLTDGSLLSYEPDWGVYLPDITRAEVTGVKPGDDKTRVKRRTNVTATFSEEMRSDTLTDSTVLLINTKTGAEISAKVSCDSPCEKVMLDPWVKLASKTKYKAIITTEATDLAGNPIAKNYTWTFTTGRK
jgi:Tol biopolymer transport system component